MCSPLLCHQPVMQPQRQKLIPWSAVPHWLHVDTDTNRWRGTGKELGNQLTNTRYVIQNHEHSGCFHYQKPYKMGTITTSFKRDKQTRCPEAHSPGKQQRQNSHLSPVQIPTRAMKDHYQPFRVGGQKQAHFSPQRGILLPSALL